MAGVPREKDQGQQERRFSYGDGVSVVLVQHSWLKREEVGQLTSVVACACLFCVFIKYGQPNTGLPSLGA